MNEADIDRWLDMKTVVDGAVYELDMLEYRITVALNDDTDYSKTREAQVQNARIRITPYTKKVDPPKGKAK